MDIAKTARKIHRALIQGPALEGQPTPDALANFALTHAIATEAAIDRLLTEPSAAEGKPAIPCTVHRAMQHLDPVDPDTWPEHGEDCLYAIYDPLSEPEDVPTWKIDRGRWHSDDKRWFGMLGGGAATAFMLRSVYWCAAEWMTAEEFQSALELTNP